jgi:hypothetical protein
MKRHFFTATVATKHIGHLWQDSTNMIPGSTVWKETPVENRRGSSDMGNVAVAL